MSTRLQDLSYMIRITGHAKLGRGKRANWLKFCHGCGKDISGTRAGQIFCSDRCAKIRNTARSALVLQMQRKFRDPVQNPVSQSRDIPGDIPKTTGRN